MVCKKCEKKLSKLACPDKWDPKSGVSGAGSSSAAATTTRGRKMGVDKRIGRNDRTFNPLGAKCLLCKANVHQPGWKYCHNCAYKKGLCASCGKMVLDTTKYKQSMT